MAEAKLKSAPTLTAASPVNSMSGLVLWLDATDGSKISTGTVASNAYTNSLDNNADVVDWMDRNPQISSGQKELTAPADNNRPKYIKNGIGGLPTLQFNGSSSYLRSSTGVIATGRTDYTIIAVWKPNAAINFAILFGQTGGNCNGTNAGLVLNGNSAGAWGCGNGYDFQPALSYAALIPYIEIARINKNQTNKVTMYLNGSSVAGSPTSIGVVETGPISVAADSSGTNNVNGNISEIIVFNRALTNAEVAAVQEYLSKKYSIKV